MKTMKEAMYQAVLVPNQVMDSRKCTTRTMVVTVVTLVVDGPVDFSRKEILFSWRDEFTHSEVL